MRAVWVVTFDRADAFKTQIVGCFTSKKKAKAYAKVKNREEYGVYAVVETKLCEDN
jgi:hypothetical protein